MSNVLTVFVIWMNYHSTTWYSSSVLGMISVA